MSSIAGRVALCKLDELADPGTRGFEIGVGDQPLRVFLVRKGELLACYLNRCPHTGAPLEWQPDQFFDPEDSFVQCAMHGALFRPEDGYCVRGPCVGQSLESMEIVIDEYGHIALCRPPEASDGD